MRFTSSAESFSNRLKMSISVISGISRLASTGLLLALLKGIILKCIKIFADIDILESNENP